MPIYFLKGFPNVSRMNTQDLLTLMFVGLVLYISMPCIFTWINKAFKATKAKITEPYGAFYALPYAMHKNTEDYYPKDSNLVFSNNKCCKSCCKNLWPLPFDVDDCPTCKNAQEKYVLSNYTCQGENGSGCVCVEPNEADLFDRRGNNKMFGERVMHPFPDDKAASLRSTQDVLVPVQEEASAETVVVGTEENVKEQFANVNF